MDVLKFRQSRHAGKLAGNGHGTGIKIAFAAFPYEACGDLLGNQENLPPARWLIMKFTRILSFITSFTTLTGSSIISEQNTLQGKSNQT